MDLTKKFRVA